MRYFCVVFILLHFPAFAQKNTGPRLTAMGSGGAASTGIWSLKQNPAGITSLKNATLALGYEQNFLDQEISTQTALFAVPFGKNVLGLTFERYGFNAYKEQTAGMALSRRFGDELSLSIGFNYHQLNISAYGSAQTYTVEAGFQYKVTEKLNLATHIANPSRNRYETLSGSNLPVKISFGVAYKFSDKLLIVSDINKELSAAMNVSTGLEYHIIQWLALRGGVSANPFKQYAGFGMHYGRMAVDAAVASHPVLGYSPQLGLNYEF